MSLRQRSILGPNPPSTSTSTSTSTTTDSTLPPPPTTLVGQSALSQALQSSAHLANLLPTGTVLAFQLLTPVFTNNGSCNTTTQPMTLLLLILLAISCFIASFTDSIKGSDGRLYYGIVTFKGLWVFDYPRELATALPDLGKYRLSFIDVVHAMLSVLVFAAVALRDKNVVHCFYPIPAHDAQDLLNIAPIGIGFVSSFLFVVFPSTRHGIGYPVRRET